MTTAKNHVTKPIKPSEQSRIWYYRADGSVYPIVIPRRIRLPGLFCGEVTPSIRRVDRSVNMLNVVLEAVMPERTTRLVLVI